MQPKPHALSHPERQRGLNLMVTEGIVTEMMCALSGGSLITAAALLLGANNFQIGIISALPAFATLFQLLAVFMLRVLKSRKTVCVVCALAGRMQLVIMGLMFLIFPTASLNMMIISLLFYYPLGSISGPAWGSWIMELVHREEMGKYFSRRSTIIQSTSITISILLALFFNYMKKVHPGYDLITYGYMLIAAGIIGVTGSWVLSKIPEPKIRHAVSNIDHFTAPLKNKNFRQLIVFSIVWSFGTGISNPFYAVYMLKGLGLPLYYVMGLSILGQLSNIISLRKWGRFADKYSNKTTFTIAAPVLVMLMISWCFITNKWWLIPIHILSGAAGAGVGLATGNISLKLMGENAVSYISVKNVIVAVFSFIAPIVGGYMADVVNDNWAILFATSGLMAFISILLMRKITEHGEVKHGIVVFLSEHMQKLLKKIS